MTDNIVTAPTPMVLREPLNPSGFQFNRFEDSFREQEILFFIDFNTILLLLNNGHYVSPKILVYT